MGEDYKVGNLNLIVATNEKKKNGEVDNCAQILFQAEIAGAKGLFNLAEIHDQN